MPSNPFSGYGKPATPQQFCGRKKNLRRIFDRISQKAPVSIVGERRIGKTSLLHYIKSAEALQEYGRREDNYLFVGLEFKSENITEREFWLELMRGLEEISIRQIWQPLLMDILRQLSDVNTELPIYQIEQFFHRIKAWGYIPVFLLDEFDRVMFSEQLDVHFFNTIRSFMVGEDDLFVMVVASRKDLYKAPKGIVGSPFFNVFSTELLQEFSPAEFDEWIEHRLAGTNVYFDEAIKQIIVETAGAHPFFSQIMASEIFYSLEQGNPITPQLRQEITTTFKQNVMPHFKYYWDHSTEEEKVWLSLLALGKKSAQLKFSKYEDSHLQELQKRALIRKKESGYEIFSAVFARMISDDVYTATHGDAETYDQFLQDFQSNQPKERFLRMTNSAKTALLKINPKYWEIFLRFLISKDDAGTLLTEMASALTG